MVEKTAQCAVFFEWIVAFGRSKGQCHHFAMTNEQLTMNNEQLASFGRSKGQCRRIGDDKCKIKNEE